MQTLFDEIYDIVLVQINDYRLDSLDMDNLRVYLRGHLISSIPRFTECEEDLTYTLAETPIGDSFDNELSPIVKNILADYVVLSWMNENIQDVSQFALHLQGRDYKVYSESENLKQRIAMRDEAYERLRQLITDYQLLKVGHDYRW